MEQTKESVLPRWGGELPSWFWANFPKILASANPLTWSIGGFRRIIESETRTGRTIKQADKTLINFIVVDDDPDFHWGNRVAGSSRRSASFTGDSRCLNSDRSIPNCGHHTSQGARSHNFCFLSKIYWRARRRGVSYLFICFFRFWVWINGEFQNTPLNLTFSHISPLLRRENWSPSKYTLHQWGYAFFRLSENVNVNVIFIFYFFALPNEKCKFFWIIY